MSNYQIFAGTVYEGFETLTGFTSGGTTGGSENTELDTSIHTQGSASIKLTTAGGASSNRTITKTISTDFSDVGVSSLDVYVPDTAKVNGGNVFLSNDSGFTNYFSFAISQGTLRNGWNTITLNRGSWSSNGSPDWGSTMVRMRFRIDAATNEVGIAYFDNFVTRRYNKPKFIFRFDDNRTSQYTVAYPILRKYGFRASGFVISSAVGTSGYMTLAQMQDLHDKGWDMCDHTVRHIDLSTFTLAQQTGEIQGCSNWLKDNGFSRRNEHLHVVFPFGGYDSNTLSAMSTIGMLSGGTIVSPKGQAYPIDNSQLLTIDNIAQTVTLASAKSRVDRLIREGVCGIFLFHIITDVAVASTEWPTADFEALCQYLYERQSQIDVMTWTEFWQALDTDRNLSDVYTS